MKKNKQQEGDMEKEKIKVVCSECGFKPTAHVILKTYSNCWDDADKTGPFEGPSMWGTDTYQIIKCLGCEGIRFRKESTNSEDYDESGPIAYETVYPEIKKIVPMDDYRLVPIGVRGIYLETIRAINSEAFILATGGIRCVVEAICQDKNVSKGTLQNKIDKLLNVDEVEGIHAEIMHSHRILGNSALHEIKPPSLENLYQAMELLEDTLKTIYVLPKKMKILTDEIGQDEDPTSSDAEPLEE